jgi:ABC-type branched-subunit amino acid transport system substrate-binding protein
MGAALIVVLATACNAGWDGKTIKLGIELPQSGNEDANGTPTANGVKLAIKQANANNTVPGYTLAFNNQDDAVNGVHDPDKGAANMRILVADATVLGVVGPFNSGVGRSGPVQPGEHRHGPDPGRLGCLPLQQAGQAQLLPSRGA